MSPTPPFRYILRYLIDPTFHPEARIEELARFCQSAKVEEVMLFLGAEELSAGFPTEPELEAFTTLACRLRERLARDGVAISLNPWATTYHNCRGRALREGQPFRRMVGENGVQSSITVCPLCEAWQSYLCDSFARMAERIRPVAIWVEDDWRLKNHGPYLGWGGCFCEEHLRRFAQTVGEPVTRGQLLEAVLRPGPPHPWRGAWLDLSCETLRAPLERLSKAIRKAAPGTRVALMSSNPDAHAAEGRDWLAFQQAAGTQPAFLTRPTMGPYTQQHALECPPMLARLTVANLHGPLEVYPELENSPRCGPYTKSRAFSVWQMLQCAVIGSAGITINHYDMLGNGISLDPEYALGLAGAKPVLNALRALEVDDRNALGLSVLFSPQISRHRHLVAEGRRSPSALSQFSSLWGFTTAILGIPSRFIREVAAGEGPVAVNEQTLRAFDDEALGHLLQRGLVLDACSVEVLIERGFGPRIGVAAARRQPLAEVAYAYEQVLMEGCGESGLPFPRMTAQRCAPWLLALEPAPGAEVLSEVRRADHASLWPGALFFQGPGGERVVSLAYPLEGRGQFFMGFFNIYRRRMMQQILLRCFPEATIPCVAEPMAHGVVTPTREGLLFATLNPSDDAAPAVEWRVPRGAYAGGEWRSLETDGRWHPIAPTRCEDAGGERLCFARRLAPLHGTFLLWR